MGNYVELRRVLENKKRANTVRRVRFLSWGMWNEIATATPRNDITGGATPPLQMALRLGFAVSIRSGEQCSPLQ